MFPIADTGKDGFEQQVNDVVVPLSPRLSASLDLSDDDEEVTLLKVEPTFSSLMLDARAEVKYTNL